MSSLHNRIALITGGSRGVGAATAELFRSEGAEVVITDVLQELGEGHANQIGANFISHDVSDETQWKSVCSQIVDRFGRIDPE